MFNIEVVPSGPFDPTPPDIPGQPNCTNLTAPKTNSRHSICSYDPSSGMPHTYCPVSPGGVPKRPYCPHAAVVKPSYLSLHINPELCPRFPEQTEILSLDGGFDQTPVLKGSRILCFVFNLSL